MPTITQHSDKYFYNGLPLPSSKGLYRGAVHI